MLENVRIIFLFAGGLGMFLYGLNIMAEGLEQAAGSRMKNLLSRLTSNKYIGVLVGLAITAVIQSSSATTVMVVGFVNAGLMELEQAVGVIMGANIGTTVTAWLVSMSEITSVINPEFIAPLILGIAAFVVLLAKTDRSKNIGCLFVGFGLLFIGLSTMSEAITPLKDAPVFQAAFTTLGKNPILGIVAGAVVTAIIQSSSASVGILQTLAMNGMVNRNAAIFITLGQNIGTCITALLSSIGAKTNAKRAAVIHLLFNCIGAVIFGIAMYILFIILPDYASSRISSTGIAIFHTTFNVTNTLILLPFSKKLVNLSKLIVKDTAEDKENAAISVYSVKLDERLLETPAIAIESTRKEIISMDNVAIEQLKASVDSVINCKAKKAAAVISRKSELDSAYNTLSDYLVKLNEVPKTAEESSLISDFYYSLNDIKRIDDYCAEIAGFVHEMKNDDLSFSDKAKADLSKLYSISLDSMVQSCVIREFDETKTSHIPMTNYDQIAILIDELKKSHVKRLVKKQCKVRSGAIYLDILNDLERITYHAESMTARIIKQKTASS